MSRVLGAVIAVVLSSSPLGAEEILTLNENMTTNVAAGETLTIDRIVGTTNATLTKTGGGTLRVLFVNNRNARFDIREGTCRFDKPYPVAFKDAYFHVDASRADTLDLEEENGTNFVVRWHDVRRNGVVATNCPYEATWRSNPEKRRPFISSVTQNGLPVVDFGPVLHRAYTNELGEAKGYGAAMRWKGTSQAYEIYEVIAETEDVAQLVAIEPKMASYRPAGLISHSMERTTRYRSEFRNGSNAHVFDDMSANHVWMKGVIYLDAAKTSPSSAGTYGKFSYYSGFHVLGITTRTNSTQTCSLNEFATDAGYAYGGQRLAEYVVFTNRLTDADRTAVQKYLNEKWRVGGNTYCVSSYAVESVAVAEGAVVEFASGVHAAVAQAATTGTLAVASGTLELSPLKTPAAYFHVDASDAETMTMEAVNGTNFVTRWNDATGNGVYATPSTTTTTWRSDPENRRPFISSVTQNGRPVVDFGSLLLKSHTNEVGYGVGYGAAMTWSARMPTSACELITVASDTEDVKTLIGNSNVKSGHGQSFLSDPDGTRGYRGVLAENRYPYWVVDNSYNTSIRWGTILMDGVSKAFKTTGPTEGFHVINFQMVVTNRVIDGKDTSCYAMRPSTFAYSKQKDSNYMYGGQRIAEFFVFPRHLQAEERREIYNTLRTKWFGEAEQTVAYSNLAVGAGATLKVPWRTVEVSGTLSLGGRYEASATTASNLKVTGEATATGALTLGSGAALSFDQAGSAFGALTVGSLAASGGTVALNAENPRQIRSGTYRLLTVADGFGGGAWTLASDMFGNRPVTLRTDAQGLLVEVGPPGMTLVVR